MDQRKQIQTQPEASPLRGDNATINFPKDAVGKTGQVVKVSQTHTGGGVANTTQGVGNSK